MPQRPAGHCPLCSERWVALGNRLPRFAPSLLTLQSVLKIPASNMGTTAEMMTAASAALGM